MLGGAVEPATTEESSAVRALATADARFPQTVLDVARDVRTDGGSAGLRRFWLLTEDEIATRTIVELKELTIPGTEFGRFSRTLDGADRFDVLKPYWWGATDDRDHFTVYVLGGRFLARDRLTRANLKPDKMSADQVTNAIQAEASILGMHHLRAWHRVKAGPLGDWLRDSAATLSARWRDAYAAALGHRPR